MLCMCYAPGCAGVVILELNDDASFAKIRSIEKRHMGGGSRPLPTCPEGWVRVRNLSRWKGGQKPKTLEKVDYIRSVHSGDEKMREHLTMYATCTLYHVPSPCTSHAARAAARVAATPSTCGDGCSVPVSYVHSLCAPPCRRCMLLSAGLINFGFITRKDILMNKQHLKTIQMQRQVAITAQRTEGQGPRRDALGHYVSMLDYAIEMLLLKIKVYLSPLLLRPHARSSLSHRTSRAPCVCMCVCVCVCVAAHVPRPLQARHRERHPRLPIPHHSKGPRHLHSALHSWPPDAQVLQARCSS